jgi:hypothetical protein
MAMAAVDRAALDVPGAARGAALVGAAAGAPSAPQALRSGKAAEVSASRSRDRRV